MSAQVGLVKQWHLALNSGDVARLTSLVHRDVEVGGPRGSARGAQIMQEWFARANVTLNPLRYFGRDDIVVVEAEGHWVSADSIQVVATVFVVDQGQITSIKRYDDLESALGQCGLQYSHEVRTD